MLVRRGLWVAIVLLALLVVCFAPPAAAASERLVVELREPFQVNGRLFPAGVLGLRQLRNYSPVGTVHDVRVDGSSVGMMLARETAERASHDELIFTRSREGNLVLVGMALEGQPICHLLEFPVLAQAAER